MAVEISDLSENPTEHLNKLVKVKGYPSFVGEQSFLVAFLFYDPVTETTSISFSEIKTKTYKLYESLNSGKWVIMIDKDGPLYLPMLPIVPAPGKIYENYIEVVGTFMEDGKEKGKYFIEVESVKELVP